MVASVLAHDVVSLGCAGEGIGPALAFHIANKPSQGICSIIVSARPGLSIKDAVVRPLNKHNILEHCQGFRGKGKFARDQLADQFRLLFWRNQRSSFYP